MYRSEDGYLELAFVVKIPMQLLKDANSSFRKYKYYVDSPLTRSRHISSFEFIAGIKTQQGQVIDRSMKLHIEVKMLEIGCKLCVHVCVCVCVCVRACACVCTCVHVCVCV